MVGAPGVHVPVAGVAVAVAGQLSAVGLGSCVAVMLHDPARGIGGMAHVLLPDTALTRDQGKPGKCANTAVPHLVALMQAAGAGSGLVARCAGGAAMFAALAPGGVNIGERNVVAVRAALAAAGIPVVGEDVGGGHGRSVYFDPGTGGVEVVSLRHGRRVL
jgi:chemotaxis protein CheD